MPVMIQAAGFEMSITNEQLAKLMASVIR